MMTARAAARAQIRDDRANSRRAASLVGRKPLAPFAPSRRKHAPPALRGHPRLEPVVAFAPAIMRLICTLHECLSILKRHQKMRPAQKQLLIIDPPRCARQQLYDFIGLCRIGLKRTRPCGLIRGRRGWSDSEQGDRLFKAPPGPKAAVDKRCMTD